MHVKCRKSEWVIKEMSSEARPPCHESNVTLLSLYKNAAMHVSQSKSKQVGHVVLIFVIITSVWIEVIK